MSRNATPTEILEAEAIVTRIREERDEARGYPGCEPLVAMLDARLAPLPALVASAGQCREILHAAHAHLREAKATHDAANALPCSLDRAVALQRRDDIEATRQVLLVREHELAVAQAAAENPLGPISRWSKDTARDAAAATASSMAVFAIANAGTPPQSDAVKTAPEVASWEPFFFARELAKVAARGHHALKFADEAGIARAVEHLAALYAQRLDARARGVEGQAEQKREKAERTARARAENHGIAALEKRVDDLGLLGDKQGNGFVPKFRTL